MAMNMEPAEGRIILGKARATEFYTWYEKAGVITRISGKRVYYRNEEGTEKFLHEFAAVVDTPEEEEALLDFSRRGKEQCVCLTVRLCEDEEKTLASLSTAAPKAKRTRRVG